MLGKQKTANDSQPVRLLVSAGVYQPANSVFLSQQASTSQAYRPRNQPAKANIYIYNESRKATSSALLL